MNAEDIISSQGLNNLNVFSGIALSDFVTLVDKRNKEVILNLDNEPHVCLFSMFHLELNLGKSSSSFSFLDKLFLVNGDVTEFKFKRLSNYKLKKLTNSYSVIEPRSIHVTIENKKVCFSKITDSGIIPIQCFSLAK